ncbi:MAG: thiamine pyrophosphate-binding protein [Thermodesulfobacteriota bacterium]
MHAEEAAALSGEQLARELVAHGFDFFTGVPCSLVASLISALEPRGYVAETREDAALGLAAGAALAGRRPLVVMQNSGFGVSLNALGSLHEIYGLPCLLVVTWRGYQGKDAPEHLVMGEAMPKILDAMSIPWRVLDGPDAAADVAWARARLDERAGPVALIVKPGVLA